MCPPLIFLAGSLHLPSAPIIKSLPHLRRRLRAQGYATAQRWASLPAVTEAVAEVTSSDHRSPSFLTCSQDLIVGSCTREIQQGSSCHEAFRVSLQGRSPEVSHPSSQIPLSGRSPWPWNSGTVPCQVTMIPRVLHNDLFIFKCNCIDIYLLIQQTLPSTS